MLIVFLLSIFITVVGALILRLLFKSKITAYITDNNNKGVRNIKSIKIIILIIIFLLSFIISLYMMLYLNSDKNKINNIVFDIQGNSYSDVLDIPLFDENGTKYYYYYDNKDKTTSYYVDENNVFYNSRDIYLTSGGYIVFLDKDNIVSYSGLYDTLYSDGEHYYAVIHPCWNEQGDLYINGYNMFGVNSIIISKDEQEQYRISHNVNLN